MTSNVAFALEEFMCLDLSPSSKHLFRNTRNINAHAMHQRHWEKKEVTVNAKVQYKQES